jgi:AcrR family transcriptional regulator
MARTPSPRQQEKNARVRQQLMKAALKVVGRMGYAKASIAKIAETAKVSTGTFYLHFKSKEELYDQLLPWANDDVVKYVFDRLDPSHCYMQFEEQTIRGFFEYLTENQAFLTVMVEAEVAAPKAWDKYCAIREEGYIRELYAAWDRGEFPDFKREAMSQICTMLLAMRKNLVIRYCDKRNRTVEANEEVIETYLQFVFGALHASNAAQIMDTWRPAQKRRVAAKG